LVYISSGFIEFSSLFLRDEGPYIFSEENYSSVLSITFSSVPSGYFLKYLIKNFDNTLLTYKENIPPTHPLKLIKPQSIHRNKTDIQP
jgi:hypothetical protein